MSRGCTKNRRVSGDKTVRTNTLILKQKCQLYGIGTLFKTLSDFMNGNMGKVNFYECGSGAWA
jgi:hypothetical protein